MSGTIEDFRRLYGIEEEGPKSRLDEFLANKYKDHSKSSEDHALGGKRRTRRRSSRKVRRRRRKSSKKRSSRRRK